MSMLDDLWPTGNYYLIGSLVATSCASNLAKFRLACFLCIWANSVPGLCHMPHKADFHSNTRGRAVVACPSALMVPTILTLLPCISLWSGIYLMYYVAMRNTYIAYLVPAAYNLCQRIGLRDRVCGGPQFVVTWLPCGPYWGREFNCQVKWSVMPYCSTNSNFYTCSKCKFSLLQVLPAYVRKTFHKWTW